jgi:chaperonin GroEL
MQRGINALAEAIRPTLGPLPRFVAIDPVSRGNRPPELLDNGGLIARRILQLPNRDADVGAMYLRQLLWKQYEEAGDGTATAAVLFQSVFNEGVRYIAAGGNPMRLRFFLEQGMKVILDTLEVMTMPLEGQEHITQLALSICHDPPLAAVLGEIFDIIGEHGLLEIRTGRGREIEHEFVEGTYFKGGLHSIAFTASGQRSIDLADAAIFISDLDLEKPEEIIHLIALAYAGEKKSLVVLAPNVSEAIISVLASVNRDPRPFQAIAVKLPVDTKQQATMLDDLAALTGGCAFLQAVGDTVDMARLADLGGARRVWADQDYLGIVSGKGSPRALRNYVTNLRKAFDHSQDLDARKALRERIGKLMGGAAILRIGGSTDLEIQTRKDSAERTAEALRGGMAWGTLPGGGAALLACRPALRKRVECARDLDERMAYSILLRGLEEPTRAIVENAGYEAEPTIAQITTPGAGFDVRCGTIADMADAGIIDSAGAMMTAVHEAIAGAALALTVEVLVHHRNPVTAVDP